MFERYDINDLFLASMHVDYLATGGMVDSYGGLLEMSISGCGYLTIVRKVEDGYIDLNNPLVKVRASKDTLVPKYTGLVGSSYYMMDFIEPLSNYYTQDGKKKVYSKRKAINEANKHYGQFNQKRLRLVKTIENK